MLDISGSDGLAAQLEATRDRLATYRAGLEDDAAEAGALRLEARIAQLLRWLGVTQRRVALIGPIGVGKSSVLMALTRLHVGEPPTTPQDQRARSVLPLGSGRTTAFPMTLRLGGGAGALRLHLDPVPEAELRLLVEDVARVERFQRLPLEDRDVAERPDPLGEELRRAVLNATGYGERREKTYEGNLLRTRLVRPLDEALADLPPGEEALRDHLLAHLRQGTRSAWDFSDDDGGRRELQALIGRINQGEEPEAALPRRILLDLPADEGEGLELIDTRGLDTGVETRADLLALLRDPGVVPLLLTGFTNAPGPELRGLLRAFLDDPALRGARERAVLLVVDKGEAAGVLDADGDRELGQAARADDCWRALEREGLAEGLERGALQVFDPLLDPPGALREALSKAATRARERLEARARDALEQADALLQGDEALAQLDEHLAAALQGKLPEGEPLDEPLEGLLRVVEGCQYWLRIRAAFRREGDYEALNLRDAVAGHAREAARVWSWPVRAALMARLRELHDEGAFPDKLLRVRRNELRTALDEAAVAYGDAVRDEVFGALKGHRVWNELRDERGHGARARAVDRLRRWSKGAGLTAHREVPLAAHVPLLRRVQQPEAAPGFTLVARNLRRLRALRWDLSGVNLLIGANGAGKSTALAALRFFGQALERGPEHAAATLGPVAQLKTWGQPEGDPIELALEKDGARWAFTLTPVEGDRAGVLTETLSHRGEVLLRVDPSGNLSYRGQDLGSIGQESGLAALLRLKKADLPLTRMAALARSTRSHRVPNLHQLKAGGTRPLPERPLEADGGNAFAVLMQLKNAPGRSYKYNFVLESLQIAFPELVEDLGFRSTETSVELHVQPPGGHPLQYIGQQADGLLQFLVCAVAVASAEPGGVVALDQPEDGLHPFAARVLLRQIDAFAWEHKLTVILATHSLVLLNELEGHPERVFVMKPGPDGVAPAALNQLFDEGWLQGFSLGDLYANQNVSSNTDPL